MLAHSPAAQDQCVLHVRLPCDAAELEAILDKLVKDQQSVVALLEAVAAGQSEAVEILLSASPEVANIKECTTGKLPLHTAAATGNISIMGMLARAGASLEQQDGNDRTALEV